MKGKRGIILAVVGVLALGLCVWLLPVVRALMKVGLPQESQMREYEASNTNNLRAMHVALMLYHDNEDRFPEGAGWMDAISGLLRANDMTEEEAGKKLRDPRLKGDAYGYALNSAVAGKYKDDAGDPSTPLVFNSSDTSRNAHGDPKELKPAEGGQAITIEGAIIPLP
jgi:hypothetical protein